MTDDTVPAPRVSRVRVLQAAVAVVALVIALTAAYAFTHVGTYRITARFVATPGLYVDNNVDILGVPTGHVESITATSNYVDVVLSLPDSVKVPAGARAVLMSPNPVSDRFVELTPAWTSGTPAMAHGSVIDRSHTVVPLELDQIYSSVSDLTTALGPSGANSDGDLSNVLHAFAQLVDGNGQNANDAIQAISAALPALTKQPDQLNKLITGLDTLTTTLATRNDTINNLYDDLTTTTGQLADEGPSLSTAIANLQRGLAQVADFISANEAHAVGSVTNLNQVLSAVMAEQQSLIKTFDTAPLGFSNFDLAIDQNAPCATKDGAPANCTALWSRADFTKNAASFVQTYCGDSVIYSLAPIIAENLHLGPATATDTACGAQTGLVQGRTGPAGSPNTPDLDLADYLNR